MKYLTLLLFYPVLLHSQVSSGKLALLKNAQLYWEIATFKEKEHIIGICKADAREYICTIDRKPWYGSDQGTEKPRNQLTKLTVTIDGKTVTLETTNMFNPSYSGSFDTDVDHFKLEKEGSSYRLYGFFSDGAGTYMAEWKITNGTSVRELISDDEKYFGWQD